jgi:polyisoprenoid-binding protein YceI
VSGLARYRVDPQGSRFTARAFAGGALSAMGHNPTFAIRDFSGEVEFDPDAPAASSLRLVAKAASLALTDNVSDKDRREIERTTRDEVLESGKFPEITYDCPASKVTAAGPTQLTLAGELTLHGVTRAQSVSLRVFPMGGTVRGQGEATVRLSEFGIRPVSVAGGMLKVKDEVKLTYDIVARLAPDATAAPSARAT